MSKPEWNEDTPKWANWLAQDSDGDWFWHSDRPQACGETDQGTMFWTGSSEFRSAGNSEINKDWKDTLEPRP